MPTRASELALAASAAAAAVANGTTLEVSVWLVRAPGGERCSGIHTLNLGGGTVQWHASVSDLLVTVPLLIPVHEDGEAYVAIGVSTRIEGVDLFTPLEDLTVVADVAVTVAGIHWVLA